MSNWVRPIKPTPMILQDQLKDVLFFDIETTTRYKTFEEYKENEPFMAKEFIRRNKGSNKMTPEEAYLEEGMLHSEHGQVVSIAWKMYDGETNSFKSEVIGFSSWEEFEYCKGPHADRDILIRLNNRLKELFGDEFKKMCGYAINGFDVIYLFNRMRMMGIEPQISLWECLKTSWDNRHLDVKDYWKSPKGMSSFGMVCQLMGLQTSKEDGISGEEVGVRFWNDHAIEMINKYCMDDVNVVARLANALSFEKLAISEQQTLEEWEEWKIGRDNYLEEIRLKKEAENEVGE
jgi:hypothetical protein